MQRKLVYGCACVWSPEKLWSGKEKFSSPFLMNKQASQNGCSYNIYKKTSRSLCTHIIRVKTIYTQGFFV